MHLFFYKIICYMDIYHLILIVVLDIEDGLYIQKNCVYIYASELFDEWRLSVD